MNKAARVTLGVKRTDHISTKELMRRARTRTIQQMSMQSVVTCVWKTLKNDNTGLGHLWKKRTCEGLETRSQARGDLELPLGPQTKKQTRSLKVKGAVMWNKCPEEIRNLEHKHVPKKMIVDYINSIT